MSEPLTKERLERIKSAVAVWRKVYSHFGTFAGDIEALLAAYEASLAASIAQGERCRGLEAELLEARATCYASEEFIEGRITAEQLRQHFAALEAELAARKGGGK